MATWVDNGIALDQDRLISSDGTPPRPEFVALGHGAVPDESGGDTDLANEISDSRDGPPDVVISKPSSAQVQWEVTHNFVLLNEGGSATITEIGIFNSANTLYMRHKWDPGHSVSQGDAVKYQLLMTKTR